MNVSRETRRTLYRDLLARWGRSLNLTSTRDRERFDQHYDDSLALVSHFPGALDRLIDMGSGGGFPAIPVAIETGVAVDLIESDRRKSAFLTTAMASLALKGTVSARRIEEVCLPPARCVTARALAPLHVLVLLARPLLADGGVCLFLKGVDADAELAAAQRVGAIGVVMPTGDPRSRLVKLTSLG